MSTVTVFSGEKQIAHGDRDAVTRQLAGSVTSADVALIRIFQDEDGRVVDLDLSTNDPPRTGSGGDSETAPTRGRGRPRLGVTAREVTLLPRHWDWLARQPGGASPALRRLVEQAARDTPDPRAARDRAYRVMTELCGDRPGYEEALRALYRGDESAFRRRIAAWPADIRAYLERLTGP